MTPPGSRQHTRQEAPGRGGATQVPSWWCWHTADRVVAMVTETPAAGYRRWGLFYRRGSKRVHRLSVAVEMSLGGNVWAYIDTGVDHCTQTQAHTDNMNNTQKTCACIHRPTKGSTHACMHCHAHTRENVWELWIYKNLEGTPGTNAAAHTPIHTHKDRHTHRAPQGRKSLRVHTHTERESNRGEEGIMGEGNQTQNKKSSRHTEGWKEEWIVGVGKPIQ